MSETAAQVALIEYSRTLLRQAQQLVEACAATPKLRPRYAEAVGPHLRHVVEHYAALLEGLERGLVDYDARPRDGELERQPAPMLRQLARLGEGLQQLQGIEAGPLRTAQYAGPDGDVRVETASCLERELLFLASHTVHHFAILRPRLEAMGLPLPPDFGKAPATVRHERERRAGLAA